ncbi:MAG: hypothetical protein EA383_13750 [Spirochaetaceae bacterium]|nr:MAG: hypothetical protein EA383_13750 [Spirochaetaceae bacterium]
MGMQTRGHLCVLIAVTAVALTVGSCLNPFLSQLDNPVDPHADGYQGYHTVEDPSEIEPVNREEAASFFPPQFTAQKVAAAVAYQFQVATENTFASENIVYTSEELVSNEHLPVNFEGHSPVETYYWRVRAKAGAEWGTWSNVVGSFTLTPITGQTPVHDSTTINTSPTLTWNEVNGAVGYELRVAETQYALQDLNDDDFIEVENAEFQVPAPLVIGNVRWWSVRAVNGSGVRSAWTSPAVFKVTLLSMRDVQGGSSTDIPNGTENGVWSVSSFHIGLYPITQYQYEVIIGRNPSDTDRGIGPDNPVNTVSWYDALVFCNTLSVNEGLTLVYSIGGSKNPEDWGEVPSDRDETWDAVEMDINANGYRLPTEAEWEWAARGGVNSNGYTYAGSNSIDDVAWWRDNSGLTTHPVGQKLPNELGLYDMTGNVWEWKWDWTGADDMNGNNPTGPVSGGSRRARGGSHASGDSVAIFSYRGGSSPENRSRTTGFRVVRRP